MKKFEKQFPSLSKAFDKLGDGNITIKSNEKKLVSGIIEGIGKSIRNNCIDKQRLRKIFNHLLLEKEEIIDSGELKCFWEELIEELENGTRGL